MLFKIADLKKKLYFMKSSILFDKAFREGKITTFDDGIFEKMNGTFIDCLPVSFYIKYSDYLFATGTCYQRSLYMFLALNDAILVRGDNKGLEYTYGEGHQGHGWIELGDYVYDPSTMLRFEKSVYYSLYGCHNTIKIDKQTYMSQYKDFIGSTITEDVSEFRARGKRRLDADLVVIQLKSLSLMLDNEQFTKDFNNYLSLIDYDEDQVHEEKQAVLGRIMGDKSAMAVISGNQNNIY